MKEQDEKAFKELLKYFQRRKYSKNTMKRWAEIAVSYLVFLESNGKTIDDIGDLLNSEGKVVKKEEFGMKDFLDTKTKFSATYMNYLCHAMKTIYEAWEKHFPIPNKEFPKVSGEPKRPLLTNEEMLKAIGTAKKMWLERMAKNKNDIIGLRDYCMVLISIDCGARRSQIQELNLDHYDTKKGRLFVPRAKGGKDTVRKLSKVTNDVLLFYYRKRQKIGIKEKALFLSSNNQERIPLSSMSEHFRKIAERAGVYAKGIGFHAPRRGKTKRLADGGLREDEINNVMGWKDGSKMSHIYIHIDQSQIQDKAANVDMILKQKKTT